MSIVSKAQYRAYNHIAAGEMSAGISAEDAQSELASMRSDLGLPERIVRPRKRAYAPRPTRRKMENKETPYV